MFPLWLSLLTLPSASIYLRVAKAASGQEKTNTVEAAKERESKLTADHATGPLSHVMFSVPLEGLSLSKREKALCIRADLISAAQILYASPSELASFRQLFSASRGEYFREVAADAQAPQISSVLDILNDKGVGCSRAVEGGKVKLEKESDDEEEEEASGASAGKRKVDGLFEDNASREARSISDSLTLTSGDVDMDSLLGGGVRRGCLTEIVGESASGKSQLGMQTAVFAALALRTIGDCLDDRVDAETADSNGGDDLHKALMGCGIRPQKERQSVVLLNAGGDNKGQQMIRRMEEMSDALIEERWTRAGRSSRDRGSTKRARMGDEGKRRSGIFLDDGCINTLQEAQEIAREQLSLNMHLFSPMNYESLDHAVSYALPALAARLKAQGKPGLGLIIVDDLPSLLIEDNDAMTSSQRSWTLRRSRMVCEIADRLKRLAITGCSHSSPAAVLVMNQVIDTFDRNQEVLKTALKSHASKERTWTMPSKPILSSAVQDGFFNGVLASVDADKIKRAWRSIQRGDNEDDAIQSLLSSTKMAALGLSWVNCINVRIMLSRTERSASIQEQQSTQSSKGRLLKSVVRRAVSVLNPFARAGEGWEPGVEYLIQRRGFVSLPACRKAAKRKEDGQDDQDDEQLWSCYDHDLSAAEMTSLMDMEASANHPSSPSSDRSAHAATELEEEELWHHQHSPTWDDWAEIPDDGKG